MEIKQIVIGAAVTYTGVQSERLASRRVRIFEVLRFGSPANELGPFAVPEVVINDEVTLRQQGGLLSTDFLMVGLLNASGEWVDGVRYQISVLDVQFTLLPADWEALRGSIAQKHLNVGMLGRGALADALEAAYLAGARVRSSRERLIQVKQLLELLAHEDPEAPILIMKQPYYSSVHRAAGDATREAYDVIVVDGPGCATDIDLRGM